MRNINFNVLWGNKLSQVLTIVIFLFFSQTYLFAQDKISLEQIMSYPFPNELVSTPSGSKIVWAVNEKGQRNIYTAQDPDFIPKRRTDFNSDDGQELSSVSISNDGKWIVFIRGGDFGSNWDDAKPVNPAFSPVPPKVQIWAIPFDEGKPKVIGEGQNPKISPLNNQVVFEKNNQLWITDLSGDDTPTQLFNARGNNSDPVWSPDGKKIAFTSNRGDHSFVGIYEGLNIPLKWIAPSFTKDSSPRWSPDNNKVVFIRRPGDSWQPDSILSDSHYPWQIMVGDIISEKAKMIWEAPKTPEGSVPSTHGRYNLHWGKGRIVFLSYEDGWPHLYSIHPDGGNSQLLTPGNFMAEHITLSADGSTLVFSGNTGKDPLDIDRRHIVKVSVEGGDMEVLTPGNGVEWSAGITSDGTRIFFLSATPQRPPLPAVMDVKKKKITLIGENLIPESFPVKKLVTPKQIKFKAPDGKTVHATLFDTDDGKKKKPAIIYVHGGPPRQMLLGWHYSSYYSNAYALNQYLASQGFVVISVNYRLGIGYGYDFHRPVDGGTRGASEYQDIKAAGEWLASQTFVDKNKIGIYGGSYGGYLTAMALGRDSKLFAAGVDIHGVHDRTNDRRDRYYINSYEQIPDREKAYQVAWESSPVSSVATWTSPVLVIHGDDDRNVAFSQSTDLVQRLINKGVETETLVIVDDTHHFMKFSNQYRVNGAVIEFLMRKLGLQ
ncbi:MAG: prolyl oligopeptidase family serine peptidase [Cyclobacteriaceae bacterium]|nr:prolyl oligopeptidase family serine peptidase [Cyclobacteriaceae bacterium]